MQPAARPRPRGQALGQEPARGDAGAPLMRHWLVFILKDHMTYDIWHMAWPAPLLIIHDLSYNRRLGQQRFGHGSIHMTVLFNDPTDPE